MEVLGELRLAAGAEEKLSGNRWDNVLWYRGRKFLLVLAIYGRAEYFLSTPELKYSGNLTRRVWSPHN